MAKEEMVRFGIFGCGSISLYRHAAELALNPLARIVAVYDPLRERAEHLVEQVRNASKNGKDLDVEIMDSEEELLERDDLDAIVVATPNSEHARLTIAALKSGRHVLCEKPMATNLEDAAAMVRTAEECGKKLMIGHNQCLMSLHLKARKLLDEGIIGKVMTFRSTLGHSGPEMWSQDKGNHTWFFKKEKAYVGCMGDLGVHKCYLLPFLLRTDFAEAGAFIETMHKVDENGKPITVDDNAVCIMRMENGIIGQLTASWTYYGKGDNATIFYGTKGRMELGANPEYGVEIYLNNGEEIKYKVAPMTNNDHQATSGISDLFVDCILDDKPVPFDGIKGYRALATVVACMESNDTKKMCKVNNELVPAPKVAAKKVAAKKAPAKKATKKSTK